MHIAQTKHFAILESDSNIVALVVLPIRLPVQRQNSTYSFPLSTIIISHTPQTTFPVQRLNP